MQEVLAIYRDCGVDDWAKSLKNKYVETALQHLEDTAVLKVRKEPLRQLASFLIQRDY